MGLIRLTPIVPGEMQPLVLPDGQIKSGFASGGPTEGRGFPQWVVRAGTWGKSHWFLEPKYGVATSMCGVEDVVERLWHPGNFARCGRCAKALATQKRLGVGRL